MFEFFGFLEKIWFLVKFLIFLIAWQLFMDFSVFWIWFDIYVKKLLLNLWKRKEKGRRRRGRWANVVLGFGRASPHITPLPAALCSIQRKKEEKEKKEKKKKKEKKEKKEKKKTGKETKRHKGRTGAQKTPLPVDLCSNQDYLQSMTHIFAQCKEKRTKRTKRKRRGKKDKKEKR